MLAVDEKLKVSNFFSDFKVPPAHARFQAQMQGRRKCSKMIGRFSIVTTLPSLTNTSTRVVNPLGFASSGFNPFRFTGTAAFLNGPRD